MKKFLAVVLAAIMALSMVSFASAEATLAGEYQIKVWVANEIVELTKAQIERYNETNTDGIKIIADVQPQSEGDAASNMIVDVEAGADLYCFAQDQLNRLIVGNALRSLGQGAAKIVTEQYDPDSVLAVTSGDSLWAYPMTADNDYFMYYDKSIIPEEDVDSLEKLIADCEEAGKYFTFDLRNAWYNASFFFGAGCISNWKVEADGKTFSGIDDDFNSDKGLVALKGMKKLVDSTAWNNGNDVSAFATGSAVVVSGIWGSAAAKEILGDNLGVADLPSFEVDGQSYHLGSYFGFKLMGVKPQEDPVKLAVLNRLAQYLTGKECALERHDAKGWRPAYLEAQEDEGVKNDPTLVNGVIAQKEYGVVQSAISGAWWSIAAVFADEIKDLSTDDELKGVLQNYENKIMETFSLDADALLFVGAWNGWNNNDSEDTYYFKNGTLTLDVPESDYMGGRLVAPTTWDTDKGFAQVTEGKDLIKDLGADNPDNNIVFAEPGNYTLTWDGTSITIVKN